MRRTSWLILFLFFLSNITFGQQINPNDLNSHQAFAEELESSKELKYLDILKQYDSYILNHPDHVSVQIERCKFIGTAYYDETEEYDLNWEKTESCVEKLYLDHPEHPDVIVYKIKNTYGDERAELIDKSIHIYYKDIDRWSDKTRGNLFKLAAYRYADIDPSKALEYANKAERFDKELDLSVLTAKTHMTLGNDEKAKEVLDTNLFYDNEVWVLSEKGDLLVELGELDKALEIFERVRAKDSNYVDKTSLYRILIGEQKFELARNSLVKDTVNEWSKTRTIQKLLQHDIAHSSEDVALATYKRMQEESYYDDFFGIKRIRIFLKDPWGSFSPVGYTHLLWLFLLLIALLIVPYLWVLPIHGLSQYFGWKFRGGEYWGLRHFWLISFVYLAAQVLLGLIFYYENYMENIFDITGGYGLGVEDEEALVAPNEMIAFSSFLLITTFLFLNKERVKYVFRSSWSIARIIGMSFAFFLFNVLIIRILGVFVDLTDVTNFTSVLSMRPEILALINEKGVWISLLIIAVFAPFYEETIFRGIILNGASKHIGFIPANLLQAALFGIIHFNFALFPFYFIFGLVTGYLAKRTGGLAAGIVFHSVNNGIAVLVLYYVSETLLQ
ncbi:MAG: CPBP family glutamic-type intramembrane protease [Bacteroidota bacterium]